MSERDREEAQAHITTFWSTVAAGYEEHGGNVAAYGSAEYQRWVDALASILPDRAADVLDVAAGTGYLALAAASLALGLLAIEAGLRVAGYMPRRFHAVARITDPHWRLLLDCYPSNPRGYFDIDLRAPGSRARSACA